MLIEVGHSGTRSSSGSPGFEARVRVSEQKRPGSARITDRGASSVDKGTDCGILYVIPIADGAFRVGARPAFYLAASTCKRGGGVIIRQATCAVVRANGETNIKVSSVANITAGDGDGPVSATGSPAAQGGFPGRTQHGIPLLRLAASSRAFVAISYR